MVKLINENESMRQRNKPRRMNELLVPTASNDEIKDLIERLYDMYYKEYNIEQALSMTFGDTNMDRLLDSQYFLEHKDKLIDELDEIIFEADQIKRNARYARNILKKG